MNHSTRLFKAVFPVILLFLFFSCSRIEIESPAKDEPNVATPYTLVVKHAGCGTVQTETFKAWLDRNTDSEMDITSAFTYSGDTWTATDYNLPMGTHTLFVRADVTTGSWCYEGQKSDSRTIFVAPCTDFVTAWGENFKMAPDTLWIQYDTTTVKIAQGESKLINIPEDAPFLQDGILPASVRYKIKNITTNNLKFKVLLNHGGNILYFKDLAFCGSVVVVEEQQIKITPSASPLNLTIEAGDILASPSDDTRPVFFSAKLQLRVYPL